MDRFEFVSRGLGHLTHYAFDCASLKSCGQDVRISPTVIIKHPELVSIGNHCAIDDYTVITTAMELADYVHIGPHVSVIGGAKSCLRMAEFTTIAAGGRVACASDEHLGLGLTGPLIPPQYRDRVDASGVVFERFAVSLTNSFIVPGVTLREGTVVGAFALLKRTTEPWKVYVGVPARAIKDRPGARMIEMAKEMGYE